MPEQGKFPRSMIPVLTPLLGVAYLPGFLAALDASRLPKELALTLLAACALTVLVHTTRQSFSTGEWILIAAVGGAMVSALGATNGYIAFRATTITVSAAVLGLGLRRMDAATRHTCLLAICGTGAITAAVALAELAHLIPPLSLPLRGPGGLFLHRNSAAHFVALALPVSWWLTQASRSFRIRWSVSAMTVAMTCFIILTRCRGAWLGAAAGIVIIVATTLWQNRVIRKGRCASTRLWIASVGTGAMIAIVAATRVGYTEARPLAVTVSQVVDVQSGSGRGRVLQMLHSIRMWNDAPLLGVGPGNWSVQYTRYAPPGDPSRLRGLASVESLPHSDYIGLLTERGLIGVILAAAGFLALLARLRRQKRERADVVTVVACLTITLTMSVVDPILLTAATAGAVTIIVAALLPARSVVRQDSRRPVAERASLAIAALWLAGALVFLGRSVLAVALYAQARDFATLTLAARIAPWDYRIHMVTAQVLMYHDACDAAQEPLARARALQPYWPAPERIAWECGMPSSAVPRRLDVTNADTAR